MKLNPSKQGGFTLIEVTIILLVLVILGTIMLPQLGNYNRLARYVKVREDVGAICAQLDKMLKEVWGSAIFKYPRAGRGAGDNREPIGLLVGPGATPFYGSKGDGGGVNGDGNWLLLPGDQFAMLPDAGSPGARIHFWVDELENHLMENDPMDDPRDGAYTTPLDMPDQVQPSGGRLGPGGAFFGWRGPYFDALTPDPWGNSYLVNVFALYKKPTSQNNDNIFTSAVVCYSAGPDAGIDTHFNQPLNDADGDRYIGWRFGDDDQGAIMSAGGPF